MFCNNYTLPFCVKCNFTDYWCTLLVHITDQSDHQGLLINLIIFVLSRMTVTCTVRGTLPLRNFSLLLRCIYYARGFGAFH